ncbi:hypothetical protein SB861_52085 [Paraburkholderia sp. SIMBA_049]
MNSIRWALDVKPESGKNVVVFTDRLGDGNSIEVNDPDGQLPRDQTGWPR